MRPIDAEALQGKEVCGTIGDISGDFIPAFEIALAPTIEAEPIRHGRPKYIFTQPRSMISDCKVICKECGYTKSRVDGEIIRHCQYCGAKMDGEIQGITWEG